MDEATHDGPALPVRVRLTRRERRRVLLAALVPGPLVALLLLPFVLGGSGTVADLVGAVVVYGGLLGLTAAVVAYDRLQARHCPRCAELPPDRGVETCPTCGYDLLERPKHLCEQRHRLYLEPGLCECGRRLHRLPPNRGIGREVKRILWFGLWLLAVLVAVAVGLQFV